MREGCLQWDQEDRTEKVVEKRVSGGNPGFVCFGQRSGIKGVITQPPGAEARHQGQHSLIHPDPFEEWEPVILGDKPDVDKMRGLVGGLSGANEREVTMP